MRTLSFGAATIIARGAATKRRLGMTCTLAALEPLSSRRPSVVISTRNRCDDLRKALASCIRQTIVPEILVMDDGSTDGTAEMVRAEYPAVMLHQSAASRGYIV